MTKNKNKKTKELYTLAILLAVIAAVLGGLMISSMLENREKKPEGNVFVEETEESVTPEESVPEEPSSEEPASEEKVSSEEPASEEPVPEETSEISEEPSEESSEEPSEESSEESSEEESAPQDDSWKLMLVNYDHPIPEDYVIPGFTELRNGNRVDSRIYPDLQQMFDDMRAAGYIPMITESYRTHEDQEAMMDYYIGIYLDQGLSEEQARAEAATIVAEPGTSEHELGLAVDISSENAEVQAPGDIWWWLKEHCWEYGFILRYPEDKEAITGITYEPWHFRYVGQEDAKKIMEQGLCLEEYLGAAEIPEESSGEENTDESH